MPEQEEQMADVGYARVSTTDQNPQLQINALEQAGCWPIYEEKASGVAKRRPVRDQTLAQLVPGDTLTVWKLDRLGRSVAELLDIIGDLEHRGVRFRCLTQPIDTTSAAGRMFLTLLAAFAEFERELMRERVLAGKARMKAEGKHPGGPRMFGYAADHETVVEAEAELLREAAERALTGETLSRVVDDWNTRGLVPLRGQRWKVTSLRRVLMNPRIVALVGEDTYRELARLFDNRENRRQQQGRPAEHLLSGILRCGREGCGQPLYGATKGGKAQPAQLVYRCKKSAGSGGRFAGCGSTVVSLARADAWAGEAFIAAVASPTFTAALNRRQAELLAGETTAQTLDDWRQEIAELEQILPTRYGTADHRHRHEDLQRLVRQATARLLQQPELQAVLDLPRTEARLRTTWEGWTTAERRTWLRRVLHHITVKPATVHHRGSDVGARLDPVSCLAVEPPLDLAGGGRGAMHDGEQRPHAAVRPYLGLGGVGVEQREAQGAAGHGDGGLVADQAPEHRRHLPTLQSR
jgi:DNA invertase Pin-like site-specific DNA recombinase